MSNLIILDTSVFIDYLRFGRHEQRIQSLAGPVRISSVVLAELWRGARERAEKEFLLALERNRRLFLTPTEANWLESGRILGQIYADQGFGPDKLRDLHFDMLIALTARSSGARLITSDKADFEMICLYRKFEIEIWET